MREERKAALEWFKKRSGCVTMPATRQMYLEAIKALEQPEIIYCTECKHYREYDSKHRENAVVVQCMDDRYPISEVIPERKI